MDRRILHVLALALLPPSAILAQEIAGTWQGKLQDGDMERRLVYIITRTNDGGLAAVFYRLDHGSMQVTANSVTLQGGAVKTSIAAIGAEYQGKLSADGTTLTGSAAAKLLL